MNKNVLWLSLSLFAAPMLCVQATDGNGQVKASTHDQEKLVHEVVIAEDGLAEIPELVDIFVGFENEELLQQLQAVESQRKDLTIFETLQITAAYLKACSWQDIRELAIDHLHENRKRYLTGASVISVFVAVSLLCESLQGKRKTKKTKRA